MKYKSVSYRKGKNELLTVDELYDLLKKLKNKDCGNYTIDVGYDSNICCTSIRNNYAVDNHTQIIKFRGD